MSKTKVENINISLLNLMQISILYLIIMILGDSVLLGGFNHADEVLDVYDVDNKYIYCRSYEYFFLYDRHAF